MGEAGLCGEILCGEILCGESLCGEGLRGRVKKGGLTGATFALGYWIKAAF